MQKAGRPVWLFSNEILSSWLLTAVIAIALLATFGWIMVPFLVIHHFYAWYGLTQANYVEHYGLMRQKLANGRYELPEPRHSWNTNHIYSNLISFHLQRHSDHHANSLRPYQALRDFSDLPRLPSGYPGSFGLAMIPPLWFRVMDPKLDALGRRRHSQDQCRSGKARQAVRQVRRAGLGRHSATLPAARGGVTLCSLAE